jgi:glycosyltransferase involved in cell wall biosynthesis
MGFTPTLRAQLGRCARPDVAHVFGFRDPIGLDAAAWFRSRSVPYVFEALGMFAPKLRKQTLKRLLDATILASLPRKAAVVVAASEVERREYLAAGLTEDRVVLRPNGIPQAPTVRSGELRRRLGLDEEPVVLYVGRVADGKGLDLLVRTMPALEGAHLAVVGPDDGHGTTRRLEAASRSLGVETRVHLLGQWPTQPLNLYADADVFALPSAHENFGMSAAEAASAGVPVVVTDRCGVAELLDGHGAIVIAYDGDELEATLARLLNDAPLRRKIGDAGHARTAEYSWPVIATLQESIYRDVVGA